MYSMLKKIITEKDLHRQIRLLEQLLQQPQVTAKKLAQHIDTTERTVFADLQIMRENLPANWQIETDSAGIALKPQKDALTNELWEVFLPHSISVQFIKALLFQPDLAVKPFLRQTGVSYETLKRHTRKVNTALKDYHLQIKLTSTQATFLGAESSIRLFYHRLLVPFTHNNYFFVDYAVHESHYFDFLNHVSKAQIKAETEEIFGVCWFFINTIRNKAGCAINQISFQTDPLFSLYIPLLKDLYQKEGVYLQQNELFFAFFCFLESWNYNNTFGVKLKKTLQENYANLRTTIKEFVQQLALKLQEPSLKDTLLAENLLLLLLKYDESPELSAQFESDYQKALPKQITATTNLYQENLALLHQHTNGLPAKKEPAYLLHLMALLQQQALFSLDKKTRTLYFLFQSEPAWKTFVEQELNDYLGKRIILKTIEVTDLKILHFGIKDLIVSNFPLDKAPLPVFYISTTPTKNELRQLAELTYESYL